MPVTVRDPLGDIVRAERVRVVASIYRLTRDLDLAEDAFTEATIEALRTWPSDGVPDRPGAWLTTVGRRRALDHLRREQTRSEREERALRDLEAAGPAWEGADDRLSLIFMCCHPALAPDARVAIALRTLVGLTNAEVAGAFLVAESTMAQRVTRAKRRIRDAHLRFDAPTGDERRARLPAVLAVLNVVFTTGHHAPTGDEFERIDLAVEGIRLATQLVALLPDEPEATGLLALMESVHARRATRLDDAGDVVRLEDADRSRWDHALAERASERLMTAFRLARPGPFQIQAAISLLHTTAASVEATDWGQIATLYAVLEQMQPSIIVRTNRAVAVAQASGADDALALLDAAEGGDEWHFFHLARGELLQRLDRTAEAIPAFRRALDLAGTDAERRDIRRRLEQT